MERYVVFMIGCWLGCAVGFLLAGLTAASRYESPLPRGVRRRQAVAATFEGADNLQI